MYKKSRFSHKRPGEGPGRPGKGFGRSGDRHERPGRDSDRPHSAEGGGGERSGKDSGYSGGNPRPGRFRDGAAPFQPRKKSGPGFSGGAHHGPPKKVFRRKFSHRKGQYAELPEIVTEHYPTPRPVPPDGFYPLDPAGPLCPLLRRPDILWQMLYADRARHRELLSMARRFHAIPDSAETSLEQDRTLAVRMFDSPAGRRWIEENQKMELLVSLDNAIYRRFLDARRQGQDSLHDLAQMLRSTERKEPNTRRTVFSLPEWEQIIAQVPDWGRRTAQNVALWACVFAIREPEMARKILEPLIEIGGMMFARWFGLVQAEEVSEAEVEDVAKTEAGQSPLPESVDAPPDTKEELSASTTASDKPSRTDKHIYLSDVEEDREPTPPPADAQTAPVALAPAVPPSPSADAWKALEEHWEAARVHFESLLRTPSFQGMEALLVCLADLLEKREQLLENSMDYLEKSIYALASAGDPGSSPDDAEPSALFDLALEADEFPLDVDECAERGEAASSPKALREWVHGLEDVINDLQVKLLGAPCEAVEVSLQPFLALAQEDSFASVPPPVRQRYAQIRDRLLKTPTKGSAAWHSEPLLDAWEKLGRRAVDFEQAVAALAQAIPTQPAEQDDNIRAFLECLEGLRRWIETHWLGDAVCVEQARQLLDLLALPKFSWQPTRQRMQELGFIPGSAAADPV